MAAVRKGLQPLGKPSPQRASQWADEHFVLVAESSNQEGAWETLPFQTAMLDSMGSDDIRVVNIQKSTRVGYTKMLVAATGYLIEHKSRNVVIFQPVDSDAEGFVKDEVDPALRDVPVLRDRLMCDPEKRSKYNTASRKQFAGAVLDIRGGKSARSYRRLTKDTSIFDELDGFDADIEGEGSPISLGDQRIKNSSFPKSIRGSTPGEKATSKIEPELLDSDMVFRRFCPCPDCDEMQPFEWAQFNYENPKAPVHECRACGHGMKYSQMAKADRLGRWTDEDGNWIDDATFTFYDENDERITPPDTIGFFLWAALSHFQTWAQMAKEFLRAKAKLKTGDKTLMKSFVNLQLGETWEDEGESIDHQSLYDRRESWDRELVPNGVLQIYYGVDTQHDRLEVERIGIGLGEESWSLGYRVFQGDPRIPDSNPDSVWHQLDDFIFADLVREDGAKLKGTATGVDSADGTMMRHVYNYTRSRQLRGVIAIRGVGGYDKPIAGTISFRQSGKNRRKVKLLPVGVDSGKALIYSRLELDPPMPGVPKPGYCHFPDWHEYTERYFEGLTAETRKLRYRHGKPYYYWDLPSGKRNEPFDCRNYGIAVFYMTNPVLENIAGRIMKSVTPQTHATEAAIAHGASKPKPKGGRKYGQLSRGKRL